MELVELIRGTQEAMDRGDYYRAAAACMHALGTYPSCLSAHRRLGEALLERGELEPAVQHFDRTLGLDPLNVVARLGLGVAAEERKDPGMAYAQYLHAWEINPALDQVRDELVRLRVALGSQDRLHPTRAGLAGLHARTGQLGRAAAEWRAILSVEPDSVRARASLAEVLWRANDDAGAAAVCRDLLRTSAENARVLAILADIERRQGSSAVADLVERYRAIDPLGEVVAVLHDLREGTDLSFLRAEAAPVPDFDFTAVAPPQGGTLPAAFPNPAASLAASYTAAPDLWDTLVRDFQSDPAAALPAGDGPGLEPFSWPDLAGDGSAPPGSGPIALDAVQDLERAAGDPSFATGVPAAPVAAEAPAQPDAESAGLRATAGRAGAMAGLHRDERPAAPAEPDDLEASLAAGLATGTATEHDAEPVAALATPAVPEAPAAPVPSLPPADPFVTVDGRVDLTMGWDDLDQALQAATPSLDGGTDYADLLAELDANGAAPFSAADPVGDEIAWEPFTVDELGSAGGAVAGTTPIAAAASVREQPGADATWGAVSEPEPAAGANSWDRIDDDLLSAIPLQQPSGYTHLLRHVDEDLLQPFAAVGDEQVVDAFANPDAVGAPLNFDDLLAVTSQDSTAPLNPTLTGGETAETPIWAEPADDVAAFEPWASDGRAAGDALAEPSLAGERGTATAGWATSDSDRGLLDTELDGIEPFAFDDGSAEIGQIGSDGDAADFSDIDKVLFDPAAYEAPPDMSAFHQPFTLPPAAEADLGFAEVGLGEREAELEADTAPVAGDELVAAEERPAVSWPAFVGHTSHLIDRQQGGEGLFARLREAKRALVDAGAVVADRSLSGAGALGRVPSGPVRAQPAGAVPAPALTVVANGHAAHRPAAISAEGAGLDLTEMRVRLIQSDEAAGEIAAMLESAVTQGLGDPLALRVLGEAYLRLGRTEQAAAQFRQAMLARRRSR